MTVNTHALVAAAPKSGTSAEGAAGGQGQASAKEAAAAFQSVLHGMKRGETPVDSAGDDSRRHPGQQDPGKSGPGEGADPDAAAAASNGGADTGAVTFSTSNLVDALRQVSHAVLSAPGGPGGGEAESDPAAEGSAATAAALAGASSAISAGAMIAAQSGSPQQMVAGTRAQPAAQAQIWMPGAQPQSPEGGVKTGTSSLFAQFGVEPETVENPLMAGAGRRSLLPEEAAGTVKILRQETHFAPNMRLSPAQQVGDQITSALKTLSAETAQGQGVTHRAEGPVLKTLDIQLTPHELGTVKVSLRMVGDSVEVTLQTSNPQTAELLKQDRQLLDQMLRTTGFKADTITIQAADDRASLQPGLSAGNASATGQNASGNGTFAEGQAQNSDRNASGQEQERSGQNPQDHAGQPGETARGHSHEDDPGNSLSDGIYL